MERIREARRAGMAAPNGLSRRRHRTKSARDSPEEDGPVGPQETVRLRDRVQKKERHQELSNRDKRRRGHRYVQDSNRDEGEESSEESVDNDDDYEEEEARVRLLLPSNQPSPSSSLTNHSNRRNFAPARVVRSSPVWKPDEMIGVPIPRKARSASAKRSHEYLVSGGVGFADEQSHGRPSTSPAGRSIDGAPASTSSVSARKKIRPKTRLPKASSKLASSSSSVQDDIEIEVAEALYDLMTQSQSRSSKKYETTIQNPAEKLDSKDKNDAGNRSGCFPLASAQITCEISNLPQDNSSSSTLLLGSASKRKRPEDVKDADENAVILTQNGLVPSVTTAGSEQPTEMETEMSLPKFEKKACEEASIDLGTSQAMMAGSLDSLKEEAVKQEEKSKPRTQESKGADGIVAKEEVAASIEESPSCAELALDPVKSIMTRANLMASEVETKREAKFEIDLMAPPPMASSPERDGVIDLVAGPKIMAQDVEMKTETVAKSEYKLEQTVKNEAGVRLEVKKISTIYVKQEQSKLDLEKPDQDNGSTSGSISLQPLDQKQQSQSKAAILEGEKSAQSSSLPLPTAVAGWPGSLLQGYMPPLQTILPMGGTTGSSPALQPHFMFSQPRPKKCATHHYIARNICCHQQLTKTNHVWPAAASPASAYGAKPYNVNVVPSAENMYHGSSLLGGFRGEKERGLASVSSLTLKDKSSEVASVMDATQKKQSGLQQAPQPVPAANLLHGPAFIFPLSQHQTAMGTTAANEAGLPKSATLAGNGPLPGNSAMGAPMSSASLPAMASAVSFSYPNLPANEAPPYMAILQNNGYAFPISSHVGMPPPLKGGTHALSFFNGSFYSSPVFHPSQDQQQLHQSQPLVQPAHQLTSASSCSSSTHKQLQSQQQQATQVSGNHVLSSKTTQLQQPQKHHVLPSHSSRKHGAEMAGESNQLIADNRAQKAVYNHNFAFPIQPMNFALMPPMTMGSGSGSSHGEKQQQQQGAKGGVELIPPQAFALSFASFNGSGTASAVNFSSMAQNPAIFQTLPDMARHGYQIAPAPQMVQHKNEVKNGGDDSTSTDDGRKAILGKSPTSFGQCISFSKPGCADPSASVIVGTNVYDSSARTHNFISSVPGNRPSRSISTPMTTASVPATPPTSQQQQQLIQIQQQQQLIQIQQQQPQQHHMMQQQMHQQQPSGATRIKAPTSNSLPASSVAVKFPNNTLAFPQTLMQTNSSGQSPHWKNSARTPSSQVPSPSLAAAKNLPQQQVRTSQGQTQISFGGHSMSGTAQHGQQIVINHQSAAPLVGSPPNSSVSRSSGSSSKTASMGSKAGPAISALPSQQSECSSNGPGQKSSPVCGRNVPSILSTCPSHLSELKY